MLSPNDKKGGRPYPKRLLQIFQDMIQDFDLIDMDLCGHQYTWEHGFGTANHIEVRLDRALVSQSFLNMFSEAKVTNLALIGKQSWRLLQYPEKLVSKVYKARYYP